MLLQNILQEIYKQILIVLRNIYCIKFNNMFFNIFMYTHYILAGKKRFKEFSSLL